MDPGKEKREGPPRPSRALNSQEFHLFPLPRRIQNKTFCVSTLFLSRLNNSLEPFCPRPFFKEAPGVQLKKPVFKARDFPKSLSPQTTVHKTRVGRTNERLPSSPGLAPRGNKSRGGRKREEGREEGGGALNTRPLSVVFLPFRWHSRAHQPPRRRRRRRRGRRSPETKVGGGRRKKACPFLSLQEEKSFPPPLPVRSGKTFTEAFSAASHPPSSSNQGSTYSQFQRISGKGDEIAGSNFKNGETFFLLSLTFLSLRIS